MFSVCTSLTERPSADLIIVPFFEEKGKAQGMLDLPGLQSVIDPILEAQDFSGKEGATLLAYGPSTAEKRILLLGIGKESACTMETLRRAYAAATKRCQHKKWRHLNVVLPRMHRLPLRDVERAVCEGVGLALYLFEVWKAEKERKPFFVEKVALLGAKNPEVCTKTEAILSGVHLARDLVNGNANDVTPQMLGKVAKDLAQRHAAVKAKIFGKKDLEKEGMGLLLAVGSGSACDPMLIQLEYRGEPKSDDVTLVVGKGVTFDTGGLNLKPTGYIEDMRTDMSGGAAALGVIQAAAALQLKANIVALVPATENAIDANSYKPGDVYQSCKGITVEITNTDAEGRLALADALTFGQKRFAPKRIVDLATLTGAVVVALGDVRMGLFSNHDEMAKQLYQAGEKTGEGVWRLPLDKEYQEALKSSIADSKNCSSKRAAGSVTAAMFLQQFIEEKTPWAHLDIAGTARIDEPRHYHLTHASGSGVRLVIEWIENLIG